MNCCGEHRLLSLVDCKSFTGRRFLCLHSKFYDDEQVCKSADTPRQDRSSGRHADLPIRIGELELAGAVLPRFLAASQLR